MTAPEEKHPADEIGRALSRAGGILSLLSNCYDKSNSEFQIGVPFIFEAVLAVEKLLSQSSGELTKLYQSYDLGLITVSQAEVQHHEPTELSEATTETDQQLSPEEPCEDETPLAFQRSENLSESSENSYRGYFKPTEQVSKLASRLDNILEAMPAQSRSSIPDNLLDRPAQTYNELLEKLTAMADAAAYQAHQQQNNNNDKLLPVLENLRADMLRIRTA